MRPIDTDRIGLAFCKALAVVLVVLFIVFICIGLFAAWKALGWWFILGLAVFCAMVISFYKQK